MIDVLKRRLPAFEQLVVVYAVIAVMIYGWTIIAFIWKLPSWLNYLTVGEMLAILSYSLFTDLLESLFILGLLTLAAMILPQVLLLDHFAIRGSIITLSLLGSGMCFFARYVNEGTSVLTLWPPWLVVTLLALSLFLALAGKVQGVGRAIFWLADQLTVFLYILLPLSLLSAVVVLFRNFL